MKSKHSSMHLFLFFLVVGLASSLHISNEAFESHGPNARSLLQQKTSCPVDMENLNYTVITSQCKGPNYTAERCCLPLKVLICPIGVEFNDLNTDCADTFFSHVNLYGKYPPGLFASLCREGIQGLSCDIAPMPAHDVHSGALPRFPLPVMLIVVLVMLLTFYI